MTVEKFLRTEQKYYLSEVQYKLLMANIKDRIKKDKFYHEKICNVYFDTINNDLIINSLNKPIYKEKVRLRSYNVPNANDLVFLELKKKFDGIVYKRRITLLNSEAILYINEGIMPSNNNQIMQEIDYIFKTYKLMPKLSLTYDRLAYVSIDDESFRITFDYNIKSSTKILKLDELKNEENLTGNNYIMEIKTDKSIPFWLLKAITEYRIYPKSYSKYGEVYQKIKERVINV